MSYGPEDFQGDNGFLVVTFPRGRPVARPVWGGPALSAEAFMELLSKATGPQIVEYSQNDPRWANEIYAGGATFARYGCLVCCVSMIASMIYDDMTPPEVAKRLRQAGAFEGALLSHPLRIKDALPGLSWGGPVHWRDEPADLEFLGAELDRNYATIAEVKWDPAKPLTWEDAQGLQHWNQHFVVVVGLTDQDAHIIDPWDGEHKLLLSSQYALDGWDVARTLYGLRLVRVAQ